MAKYQAYTAEMSRDIVKAYQDGLSSLNAKVAKLWASGQPAVGDVLDVLRTEVRTLIAQRQIIIKGHLPRIAAKSYSDILYQAAKIVGVDVNISSLSDAEAAKLIRKRPKSVPEFGTLLRKHAKESAFKAPIRAGRELGEMETEQTTKIAIKRVLTTDANEIMRFTNAEATRVINNAVNLAFEVTQDPTTEINNLIRSTGLELVKVWIHDSPAVPREYHRDVLHGSLPDREGYWHQDGDKADGPGGFSDPGNNIGCRCSIDVMTVQEYLSRFGRGRLQPWSYLPSAGI